VVSPVRFRPSPSPGEIRPALRADHDDFAGFLASIPRVDNRAGQSPSLRPLSDWI
jgi:hypothetical protein